MTTSQITSFVSPTTVISAAGAAITITPDDNATGFDRFYDVTLSANCVVTLSAQAVGRRQSVFARFRQDATGGRALTISNTVAWSGGSAPTFSTVASHYDEVQFITSDGGGSWLGVPVAMNASTTAAIALNSLVLSPGTATAGSAYSGTISNATTGSMITASSSDSTVLSVTGTGATRSVSGTFSAAGSKTITLTETLAGATNSPHPTTALVTVSSATQTLGTLSSSSNSYPSTAASGTVIGTIIGTTAGSTVTLADNQGGRFAIGNPSLNVWTLLVGLSASTAGTTYAPILTETLSSASNSPKNTTLSITCSAVTTLLTPTTAIQDGTSDASGSQGVSGSSTQMFARYDAGATGQIAFIQSVLGNVYLHDQGYLKGVGGSSTEGMIDRASSTSNAATGNPAFSNTGVSADAAYSTKSSTDFTAYGGSHNVVTMSAPGINDNINYYDGTGPSGARTLSLSELGQYFDQHISAGRQVWPPSGKPYGRSAVQLEKFSNPTGPVTVAGPEYFVDGMVYGVPPVAILSSGTVRKVLTKTTGTVGTGQYSVTSGGVYTFGSDVTGDSTAIVYLTYSGQAPGTTVPTYQFAKVLREWMLSSAATFTSAVNGVTYTGISGAQYGTRAGKVVVYDGYAAMVDSTSAPGNDLMLPGCQMNDGLQKHFSSLGAYKYAKKMKADYLANTNLSTLPDRSCRPTRNNWFAAKGTGSTASYTGTLPVTMRTGYLSAAVPMLIANTGTVIGKVNTDGSIVPINSQTIITSGTYNWSTGVWSITMSSTTALASGTSLWFEQDIGNGTFDGSGNWVEGTIGRNCFNNGLMELFTAVGTGLTSTNGNANGIPGLANTDIPYGWALTALTLVTMIGAGTASNVVPNPTTANGYTEFGPLDIEGYGASSFLNATLFQNPEYTGRITPGDKFHVGADITYANHGTIGAMYGIYANFHSTMTTSSGVTRTISGATYTNTVTTLTPQITDGASVAGSGNLMDSSMTFEAGGPFKLTRLAPRMDTTGMVINGGQGASVIQSQSGVPFAVRYGLQRPQARRNNT